MATALLLLGWGLVAWDGLTWIARGLLQTDSSVHRVVLVGWVALAWQTSRLGWQATPRLAPLPLVLLLLPLVGWQLAGDGLASLEAAAVLVSGTGLAGLFLPAATWRRSLPLALLAVGVLPVSTHLDVVLGLPLRRFVAACTAPLFGSLATETVLAIEGGYAHVDLPCAGVDSLWSAGVVLAGAAVVWGRRLDAVFVGVSALTAALLVAGNVTRVATLVGLHHVLDAPMLASIVHTPLGVLTFLAAVGPALAVLHHHRAAPVPSEPPVAAAPVGLVVGIGVVLVGLAAWPAAERPVRVAPTPHAPAGWEPVASTPQEASFIGSRGGVVRKARHPELGASLAMVSAHDWVVQHDPSLCLSSGGWVLDTDRPVRIGDRPVRIARVARDGQHGTAIWWYQAEDRATDDLAERIAASWTDPGPWVLVSVLLDHPVDPASPLLPPLTDALAEAVSTSLKESP
jgi:exosortase O